MSLHKSIPVKLIRERFRGFLPVVVDVETAGINPQKNALLEVCIVLIEMDAAGKFFPATHFFEHVLPFEDAELDAESLAFNGIDPFQPLRFAVEEKIALQRLFTPIQVALQKHKCQRAVLVGHNAWFDLLFIKEAINRTGLSSPFHAFTCFDTATLAGFIYGQTVLAKALQAAHISFDVNEAHSAIYDAQKTAELFCKMMNLWGEKIISLPQQTLHPTSELS
ncbi:ribonuclease T [Legionella sp. 27cVA30]|uniref:ribonuclease T n=1 Tax=Legionella TaxID=445 RepID=UPI000F8DE44B|nr:MULTISPECIES: ribonuclease T [Legionella]MCP0914776.1 ribonuclease T [Legionella sp. 27cVA30]RUR16706.1 ribonuclease T [Legionella septentrionalis]